MNRSPASYHRKRTRMLPAVLTIVVCVVALAALWVGFGLITGPSEWRQSAVLVGDDTTHIVSWNATRNHVVLFDIPSTSVIEGTRGYGKYSLKSLFALDSIDRHGGRVYVESLSDALGLPFVGYSQLAKDIPTSGSVEMLRAVFSWGSLFDGRPRSVPWSTWAAWVLAARSLKADQVDVINAKQIVVDQPQPDGSQISIVDTQRFDYLYGSLFIDTGIRTEEITVSIYNTTGVPTIGQRASRVLAQIGMSVVTVGNKEAELARCVLSGDAESLRSHTGRFIAQYFDCDTKENEELSGTSDLSLQLGTDFSAIFTPKK